MTCANSIMGIIIGFIWMYVFQCVLCLNEIGFLSHSVSIFDDGFCGTGPAPILAGETL